ncbi:MAG: glycosyltransferase family 4 protein [Tepidisphaeraceae bacterium]|jgi:glycosyltransferase involved in cell wall biosynthesis
MRIAIVAHNLIYGDGQGRINLEIARQALRAGAQVVLVSVTVDPELIRAGAVWEKVRVIKRPVLLRVVQFAAAANRIVDRLRASGRVDHVIANGYTLTRPHDLNLCQFVHSAWLTSEIHDTASAGAINRVYQAIYTRYNARHERRSFRAARKVIAPSRQTADELRQLGVASAKVCVVPNGVACSEFFPGPESRSELGLPEGVPIALFVGNVRTNRKGLGSVLQALADLPEVHLAVVGQTSGSPFLAMAAQLGVERRTHFLGFRKDVAQIMRACDLFVFPSWYDPFGLVITEAMASGLPVITTGRTGAGELLNDKCGTLVSDPADVGALAAALRHWLSDSARRSEAGLACRAIAESNGWVAMANRYLELLVEPPSPQSERDFRPEQASLAY